MTGSRTNIRFRDATSADAVQLASFAASTFNETFGHLYKEEDLSSHLEEKCSVDSFATSFEHGDNVILAYDGDELVGYCKIGDVGLPVAHPPTSSQEIHRIYVRRKYQGSGLGQELLKRALATKRLQDASLVYLGVWEENDRAKQFYYKNGFLPVGRYLYPVGQQVDNEMILARVQALH
jgi:ribosomal protein S18 acetylase RimI-like enzyme